MLVLSLRKYADRFASIDGALTVIYRGLRLIEPIQEIFQQNVLCPSLNGDDVQIVVRVLNCDEATYLLSFEEGFVSRHNMS